jgi:hypothetical protein
MFVVLTESFVLIKRPSLIDNKVRLFLWMIYGVAYEEGVINGVLFRLY